MRVSSFEKFKMTQHRINNMQYESSKKLEQISTGKIFNRVSDDPVRVNRSMLIKVTESRINQFNDNVNDAKSLLEFMDMTFDKATNSLDEAKEQAVKGANDTYSKEDREVMAQGIEETIKQILGFANAQHLDRHMFSGEKLDATPISYDGTNFTYNGNGEDMKVRVSEQMEATVSQSAEKVFIPVLNELVKVRDALRTNDQSKIESTLKDFDKAKNNFIDNRSTIGVQLQSVELLSDAYSQTKTDLSLKKQETEDVNMADAISDFMYTQNIMQATIKSSVNMMKNSILDYI
ncbi:flagellar hook-associated protein FlgL [Bacillus toyonensis]|uniref:flagellar hook-associated protein FlgL n=1 Tax=Bacillus toyonensis TaxID=155322 RepID=UPI002E2460CB|nr:flagellar hook-associated protein FlgL [Bacillus toyonensis]MED2737530.1 flagellar hook-associated protein FlgL [Bacillus toyonensis]